MERVSFGVAWKCAQCGDRKLVICPFGPMRIGPATCLQCGAEGVTGIARCRECGTSLADVLSDDDRARDDDELLAVARASFAEGTCRRGLTIVNFVLQRSGSTEAIAMKRELVDHLDRQQAFLRS